jgi:hypothetical protein
MINSARMYDFEIFRSGNALPLFVSKTNQDNVCEDGQSQGISDAYWFRDNSLTFKIVSTDA